MRDLRATLVQCMLHWEDAQANREQLTGRLAALKGSTDLIVLPEMFSTGFSMRSAELAEDMSGPTVTWMKEQASSLDAALYGSLIIREGDNYYNRGLFIDPEGQVTIYDKRHLFRFANETAHYTAGQRRVVVNWRSWRLLLQICFDLRFPVFARNRGDHDAILYVANWPEPRRYPWNQLLIARAIENQCYVIGVNRVGMDGKGLHYTGDSVIIDPKGQPLLACEASKEETRTGVLGRASLEDFREKFPVAKEADDFELRF